MRKHNPEKKSTAIIRYLSPDDDLTVITDLVHAAYASRAEANLNYWATHQSIQDTAKRFSLGQGFIAELNGRIVGTLMIRPPQADSTVPLYRDPSIWTLNQFGVLPELQGCGIGRQLHEAALEHAKIHGGKVIALDTAAPATALIEMYRRWGYSIVGECDWRPKTNYLSIIMSRLIVSMQTKPLIKLRPALVSDAKAIGNIRVSAWQAAYQAFMPKHFLDALDPLANLDALREKLAHPTNGFIVNVADVDGSVVAFSILGSPRYATHIQSTELWALNVHPDFWQQGIGCTLTLHAVDTAKTLGFQSIELWCIHGNLPACATYESCGFTLAGQERTSSTLTGHPLREVLYTKVL